jgi:hypothetical protein
MGDKRVRPGFNRTIPGGVIATDTIPDSLHKVSGRRLNRCMMLEFDATAQTWKDALRRTPPRGVIRRDIGRTKSDGGARAAAALTSPLATPLAPRPTRTTASASASSASAASAADADWGLPLSWIGVLLAICPPMGVTMVWASPHIPREGKLALTMFGSLVMILAALFALAAVIYW